MEADIKRRNTRRLSSEQLGSRSVEEVIRHFTRITDDLRTELVKLAESVPGNQKNVVRVTAIGDSTAPIEVTNPLGYVPKYWKRVDRDGAGDLWRSKQQSWSKTRIYFESDAAEGTIFDVLIYGRR